MAKCIDYLYKKQYVILLISLINRQLFYLALIPITVNLK